MSKIKTATKFIFLDLIPEYWLLAIIFGIFGLTHTMYIATILVYIPSMFAYSIVYDYWREAKNAKERNLSEE